MNRMLLTQAATLANILDKAVINNSMTFEADRTLNDQGYSQVLDTLYLVDRGSGEKIKIWEAEYDG